MYRLYLKQDGKQILLPVTPSEIETKTGNRNKAVYILNFGEMNLAKKPGLRGFREAARKLGLPPEKLVMVGDQTYTDMLGARRFGCKGILVESTDTYLWYFWPRRLLELPFRKERR